MLLKFVTFVAFVGLLANAAEPVTARTQTEEMFRAIRAGDLKGMEDAVARGADVNGRDADGNTPLMYAALYLPDATGVRKLLARGANPNATNAFGATALIWATSNMEKVKVLVEHGADVNACSKLGKSALLVAASRDGGGLVVSYLLAHGAQIDGKDNLEGLPPLPLGGGGASAVIQAAKARDGLALRALIERGADVNAKEKNGNTALMAAVASQNHRNTRLLLERGADVNAINAAGFSALILACMRNDATAAAMLLAHGAKVEQEDMWGNTPLMWAAASEKATAEVVLMMTKSGADANHKNKMGETAFIWASRRGDTPIVAALRPGAPAIEGRPAASFAPVALHTIPEMATAIDKSLPQLQKSGPAVFKQRGCVSCHNNMLPAIAASLAQKKGHKIDEAALEREHKSLLSLLKPTRELLIENGDNVPDLTVTAPYALLTLAALGHQPDILTDALVHNLTTKQNSDGSWTLWAPRPPIEYGDIQATALSIRALQLYPLEGRRAEFEERVQRAGRWLAKAQPYSASDQNWRLLGLYWSKTDRKLISSAAIQIFSSQRADGGWAQLAGLATDPYATGQTLYALGVTGMADMHTSNWNRGVGYLLRTQQPDGTWWVRSRSFPFQPYFESGFPYGPDQWISVAGSSWATIALAMAESTATGGKNVSDRLEARLRTR